MRMDMAPSHDDLAADYRHMSDDELMVQQVAQRAAEFTLQHLLEIGVSEQNAAELLDNVQTNKQLLIDEAIRRGKPDLFAEERTSLN